MPAIFHEPIYLEIIIWLFPITFMFHALEEIITIENFIKKYKHNVPHSFLAKMTLTMKKKLGATSPRLSISMAWILFFISLITLMTAYLLPIGMANFLLYSAILNLFFLQAISHIGQTIILKAYTPGIITAICLVIPYSLLTYCLLFKVGFIDGHLLVKSIPYSMLMVPIFLLGNLFGRK